LIFGWGGGVKSNQCSPFYPAFTKELYLSITKHLVILLIYIININTKHPQLIIVELKIALKINVIIKSSIHATIILLNTGRCRNKATNCVTSIMQLVWFK